MVHENHTMQFHYIKKKADQNVIRFTEENINIDYKQQYFDTYFFVRNFKSMVKVNKDLN